MVSTLIAAALAVSIGISEPRITGVAPGKITTSPKPVQITLTGSDFRGGLTLIVTMPGGEFKNYSGADITGLGATTFRAAVVFEAVGPYEFVVMNSDGGKSPPFRVDVKKATAEPSIERVMPAEVSRTQELQVVSIRGSNFEQGMKLSITDPTGTVTTRDVFDRLEPSVAVVKLAFDMAGTYALMVMNPSGASSNSVSITVR